MTNQRPEKEGIKTPAMSAEVVGGCGPTKDLKKKGLRPGVVREVDAPVGPTKDL